MADPFAQYLAPAPEKADPFAQYLAPAEPKAAPSNVTSVTNAAPSPAPPAEPETVIGRNLRSFLGVDPAARFSVSNLLHPDLSVAANAAKNVVENAPQGAADMATGALQSAGRAINANPMDIARHPGAALREGVRSINDLIPGANTLAESATGPKAVYDAEDEKAVPGVRDVLPTLALAEGGGRALARGAGEAAAKVAEGAGDRVATRALEKLEEKVGKKARGGIQTEPVETLVREDPAVRNAAGDDGKLAVALKGVKQRAGADLDRIYKSVPQEADPTAAIDNMDKRIAELRKSTDTDDEATANKLQAIRDLYDKNVGTTVTPRELRAKQSELQRKSYGKAMAGDVEANANLRANAEASKAVGDAVFQHVLGTNYVGARAMALAEPDGVAAQLLKANERINAATKIEAGIDYRAGLKQPREGIVGKAEKFAHVVRHPTTLIPAAVERAAGATDAVLSRAGGAGRLGGIPAGPDAVLVPLIRAADGGDPNARARLATLAASPIVGARVAALRQQAAQ